MNIFTQFFKTKQLGDREYRQEVLSDLMRREAELNKNIFGPVPHGVKRDFFCLDKHTWIWYEEWTDKNGNRQQMTTRYLVREKDVVKSINGGTYSKLTVEEAKNFQKATAKYYKTIKSELYIEHEHPKGI